MQNVLCDVIGCPNAAAWARFAQIGSVGEDRLCHACWLKLAARSSHMAALYVVCNADLVRAPVRSACRAKQNPAEDVIV